MEHGNANDAPHDAARAPSRYPTVLPNLLAPRTPFHAVMLAMIGEQPRKDRSGKRDGRHAKMRAVLDNRAAISTIRSWCSGRRNPPQWAYDLLNEKIHAGYQAAHTAIIEAMRQPRGMTRQENGKRLMPLKRAKEKARREAGQSGQT